MTLLLTNTILIITAKKGAQEVCLYGSKTDVKYYDIVYEAMEAMFPAGFNKYRVVNQTSPYYDSMITKLGQIEANVTLIRNAFRYGTHTESGVGVLDQYPDVDALVRMKCANSTTQKLVRDCDGSAILIDRLLSTCIEILQGATLLPTTDLINNIFYMLDILDLLDVKLGKIIETFADHKMKAGIPVDLTIIFIIAIIFILLLTYPLFNAYSAYMSINYQIRQMLLFVPMDIIESVPIVKHYVETNTISTSAGKKSTGRFLCCPNLFGAHHETSSETKSFIEASNDAVVICNEQFIVSEVNKIVTDMFGAHSEDILGIPIFDLFIDSEHDNVQSNVKNVFQSGKGLTMESTCKRKNTSQFPTMISIGSGYYNQKKVTVCFFKDTTIEKKQQELLKIEQQRAESLLLNILPSRIATKLKNGETTIAEQIDDVTILFTDMVGFTAISGTVRVNFFVLVVVYTVL